MPLPFIMDAMNISNIPAMDTVESRIRNEVVEGVSFAGLVQVLVGFDVIFWNGCEMSIVGD